MGKSKLVVQASMQFLDGRALTIIEAHAENQCV